MREKSTAPSTWPKMPRSRGRVVKAWTLLSSGATAATCSPSDQLSYCAQAASMPNGSVILLVRRLRKPGSASSAGISQIVMLATVLAGALLTFFVLRSIARPLRRLVIAMDGLNAGNTAVEIPAPGPDEMGAMARTLAAAAEHGEHLQPVPPELLRQTGQERVAHQGSPPVQVRPVPGPRLQLGPHR